MPISKLNQTLLLAAILCFLLIALKVFLIPLLYGLLIALIVYPVCIRFEKIGIPKALSIFLALMLVVLVLSIIVFVFILQIQALNKEFPKLLAKMQLLFVTWQQWLLTQWGVSLFQQNLFLIDIQKSISSNIGNIAGGSFSLAASSIFMIIIIPIYSFLILLYRRLLINYLTAIIDTDYKENLKIILSEAIQLYFKYVKGMLLVYISVGILNSIGLLLLGVKYAVLFGFVTAFMTIIPYFGIIVSSLLPITLVWIETNNIWYPIGVILVFTFVQYLEANLIFPYIVGRQLGLNTLISIIAILLGGALWGLSGMILLLPFVALLKIISTHIPSLKNLSDLLGFSK